ncbi:ribosomal protein S18 acetylase RimI-like enzyme [Pseudorhizobium tarimense]|uniref:Ribosomal protein S18 acetylase RimI-like enzyme n=1 Tax=Pseudorhizobium tarimense TaxID=1079109 RepID=A0ABV2HCB7_9HYPH|nr:GNAT family N-acetyltransferase [Pseudorhizobium tarimense]MCJ8521235.1 GNAT family N-acetyltransferase [Pseudorhizobium tarimense]
MDYILAGAEHDHVVIDNYLAVWESYGTPADYLREDAEEVARQFLYEGRRERKLASFIAFEGKRPAGSISCQLHMVPYPAVLKPEHMLHGYIWTVYTDPSMRGQGIAGGLMSLALKHLQDIGCTTVVLHSSEAGQNLYHRIGFQLAKEMRLKFATSA